MVLLLKPKLNFLLANSRIFFCLYTCKYGTIRTTYGVDHKQAANESALSPFIESSDLTLKTKINEDMIIHENFVKEEEEKLLLEEIEPHLKRLRYEKDHWDDAIHNYREIEKAQWNQQNSTIIQRIRDLAFPPGVAQLHHVHILDIAQEGYIKPHIDSIRFCGNTIAGLSLLSSSVMRLVNEKNSQEVVDILLPRRSLYIMKNKARFEFTHEILDQKRSLFGGQKVMRSRRISVICRNEPITQP